MKKFFAFCAMAVLSVVAFAQDAPSDAVLANYYTEGQLCVCVKFEGEICNDIVWVGTYHADASGWLTDVESLARFEPVEGYDDWWVVAVNDDSENIQGKPVQLMNDGGFDWPYQTGDVDSWTIVRGTVTIEPGYSGESNLVNYDKSTPVVLISAYWKNHGSPCIDAPEHTYTIVLAAPDCVGYTESGDEVIFEPAIIGDFNGWSEGVAMEWDEATDLYSIQITCKEGKEFKFKEVEDTDWTNQIQLFDAENDNWYDNPNRVTGTEELIEIDYSEGRYTLCGEIIPEGIENVENAAKAEKVIENGQLILIKNGVRYNTVGAIVK